jgi:hypothetical protein
MASAGAGEDTAALVGITSSVEAWRMLVRLLAFGLGFGVTLSDRNTSNDRLSWTIGIADCEAELCVSRFFSLVASCEWRRWRWIGEEISDMERVI